MENIEKSSKFTLRPRQQKLKDDIKKAFKKYKKLLVVAPCAFGKTPTAVSIMEDAVKKGKKILFIVDREELINQCSETLEKLGLSHSVFLKNHKKLNQNCEIQVSSWQTLIRLIRAGKFLYKPDLIIYDEAHRSVAETPKEVLNSFPDAYLIGFTGTPYREDNTGLCDIYEMLVESCSAIDLINEGLLVRPDIFHCEPDVQIEKIVTDDLKEIDFCEAEKDIIIGADVVRNYQRLCDGKQALIFCPTVDRAKKVAEKFQKAGISANHVECHTKNREKLIKNFKEKKFTVLTCASLLAEGFDHPSLECVILYRKMDSRTMYRQACNRCMRIFPGKKNAYILDFFDNIKQHGYPFSIEKYSLTETFEVEKKIKEEDDEKKEGVTCNNCQKMYEKILDYCPDCGAINDYKVEKIIVEAKKDLVKIELSDQEQDEIDKKREYSKAEKQQEYTRLCVMCMERAFRPGWVSVQYKEKFGIWPNRMAKPIEFVRYCDGYENSQSRVSKQLEWKMGIDE